MNILLFGITREIVGTPTLRLPSDAGLDTVADLKVWLMQTYPQFKALRSLAVAIDKQYADDDQLLTVHSEVALIPPVSGG